MSKKISDLTAASSLAFDELIEIVQSGASKKAALSLFAGRLFAKSAGLWYPLAASAVGVSCPADTTEDTLATVTVPAGAMGANGQLRIWTLWTFTNSANVKTLRVRFGGISGTQYFNLATTTNATANEVHFICNRNSQSSQIGGQGSSSSIFATSTNANTTSAVDTSAQTTLVITGQKASSGETLTLEAYSVDLLYQA